MTDGILLAEIQRDRLLRALRHDHHRRGARAQPQHRLPARLPQAAAAAPPRPQGDRHLGDDRPGALRRGTSTTRRRSRSPAAPTRSRSATGRYGARTSDDGDGPATRSRRSATPSRSCGGEGRGDVLVFLSGEREIRDTADALREAASCASTEILPLYARLSAAEQHRVFAAAHRASDRARDQRRRDVADRPRHPLRRRPRHGAHLALQPPAPRCSGCRSSRSRRRQRQPARGPLRPRRRRHLHPPVLGGGLRRAPGVHRAGDPAHQPRVGHPADDGARPRRRRARSRSSTRRTARSVRDGVELLHELGALDPAQEDARSGSPRLGRQLAQLPVDPRLGRMVLEATAGLRRARCWSSRRRCRSRTRASARSDKQQAADQRTPGSPTRRSDFLASCSSGPTSAEQQERCRPARSAGCASASSCTTCASGSGRTSRRSCDRSPRSVGVHAERQPARATPSASHARCSPDCCRTSACGRVEKTGDRRATTRVPRRPRRALRDLPGVGAVAQAARVGDGRPSSSRPLGCSPRQSRGRAGMGRAARAAPRQAHLQRAPLVEARRGSVVAVEKVTLYGVPIVAGRNVQYGRIDPELSRELFIRHALVEGEWRTHHPFFAREPGAARRRRGAREPRPPPRHPRRRRDAVRLLRRPDPGRRRVGRALRHAGGSRPGTPTRTC